jgi:hypothetical protein
MYQQMVYYNRMHVKTRLSQSILSKIVYSSNTITLKFKLIQLVDIMKLCTQLSPSMNSIVNMLLQHCSTVTTWNNIVDNLFIVACATLFMPVDVNLQQPVRFYSRVICHSQQQWNTV